MYYDNVVQKLIYEKQIVNFLSVGSASVSLLVLTGVGPDPVNLPKMTLLGIIAFVGLGLFNFGDLRKLKFRNNLLILISSLFGFGLIVSTMLGQGPITQNFYGTFGRYTGSFTYFCLFSIALCLSRVEKYSNFLKFVYAFLGVGFLNIIYCIYVILSGKDFFSWTNPYNKILGTFGNPNFISSFLGMSFVVLLSIFFQKTLKLKFRLLYLAFLPAHLFLIVKSSSTQGLIVAIIGVSLVVFFLIRSRYGKLVQLSYICTGITGSIFLLLGMLQIGPLTELIYKPSVSIRGAYWRAAIKIFESSPIYGIGLDSYGDFYRRFRDTSSLVVPGSNVSTDAAHNVFLDLLSGGGLLLFIPYVFLIILIFVKSMNFVKTHKKFDPIFVAIFSAWVCYLCQSVISINQIGIAIWGWVFSGLLIAYCNVARKDIEIHAKPQQNKKAEVSRELSPKSYMKLIVTLILGVSVSTPMQLVYYN